MNEENGLNITDWDATIYRIFSKKWFLELLKTQRNGLVATRMWDDPFENFFLKCTCVTRSGERVSLANLHNSWFGQCWTFKEESDAMWRIYSADKTGVRVSTTLRKLFSSIWDPKDIYASLRFFIGKVSYKSRTDIEKFLANATFMDLALGGKPDKFAQTLCVKREEFAHEDEVRLLFQDVQEQHTNASVVPFHFNTATLIESVVLDPQMSESKFLSARDEIASYGYTGSIRQSELYKFNPPDISLE